ncbi:hypothetical protein THAOC_34938 [Thalassiosira oceanica]|uniref:Uncharacterized protein n=1 Tax=Thalassiosira oceanica TaxID=159749 RepID=K0R2M9_THAOC|nr:hypothetical protein THAOC_34938 [Thalassiosira oceanica]|eukprot:EJK46390.1 hypothetical protein THAOC_34938 [Thalassiosira oceanica]
MFKVLTPLRCVERKREDAGTRERNDAGQELDRELADWMEINSPDFPGVERSRDEPNQLSGHPPKTTQGKGIMSAIDEIDYQTYFGSEGSWTPTILIASALLVRYLHSNSVSFQRFVSQQRIHWRRRLGYRDNTKYQMGVGDGANMSLKRQG